jgi:hypothetical protein
VLDLGVAADSGHGDAVRPDAGGDGAVDPGGHGGLRCAGRIGGVDEDDQVEVATGDVPPAASSTQRGEPHLAREVLGERVVHSSTRAARR